MSSTVFYRPVGVSRMSDADRTYLKAILGDDHGKRFSDLPDDEHFEIFVAEQVIKKFALDSEETQSAITRGNRDGGVDAIYFLIDRKLIREDPEIKGFQRKGIPIDLVIVQATRTAGFEEEALNRLLATTNDLLDLSKKDISKMASAYNPRLLEIVNRFRNAYIDLLSSSPSLTVTYYYVSQGDAVDKNVQYKADRLLERVRTLYSAAICDVRFIGAKELLDLYNQLAPQTLNLQTARLLSSSVLGTAYVCLVPLNEYFEFIVDAARELRQDIFESNVRDYQPDVRVNADIQKTLATGAQDEFWWLNNGVTIIASRVTSSADILTVEEPEIVNGLQTSREIYNHGRSGTLPSDKRNVLVRVIEISDTQVRDRIIKATNNQTPIPSYALHATEEVHRKIESYLPSCGLFYERRKSYWRNRGVQVAKIITIQYLAQAVAAIALQRPDDSRARPSTVMERHYTDLFDEGYAPELYRNCALLMKRVQAFLKEDSLKLDKAVQSNVGFHVAMYAACIALNSASPSRKEIAKLRVDDITDTLLADCLKRVQRKYDALGANDQVAKGTEFVEQIKKEITSRVRRARKKAS